jgi:hypothetical protein
MLAAVLSYLLGGALALGLAVAFGAMTYFAGRDGDARSIRVVYLVVFYTASFFALAMPIFTGAMNPGFDAASLRIFPISRRRLYAITFGASALNAEQLFNYPALTTVILIGLLLSGSGLPIALAGGLLFLLFLVAWGNTIALFMMGLMRNRRAREVTGIAVFGLLIVLAITPALLEGDSGRIDLESRPWVEPVVRAISQVGGVLPPTLAAEALASSHRESGSSGWPAMLGLLLWNVAGIMAGYRIFATHVMGDGGMRRTIAPRTDVSSPMGESAAWRRSFSSDHAALAFIPAEVRAVAAKEIRYLLRSAVGKFNLVMMPVLALIAVFIFGRDLRTPVMGLVPEELVLFGLLLYATLLSNNFTNNAFGWERRGMQTYFFMPVDSRRIIAGKNLGVWTYNCILLGITLVTWSLFKGIPGPGTLLSAVIFYASCVLAFTSAGNVVSVLFPVGRDMSSLKNTPSQVAILLSLLFIVLIGAVNGLFLFIPLLLDMPALRPLSLIVLLAFLAGVYNMTLRLASRLMAARKEKLIEAVQVAD